ncbi:MAG: bifunctional UDP-N-acetylglucosamine diphosphorylase/glucosamine-1-phosphate N-acetyltransferase GlmU [Alphaproteobacteria bacterium]|nr:bifunctional UDP-N-acetylglucosamine diphosphorylase/glucosamine-1-phosphate N-acetyltransferase GlmU [Alphaproteobacteria bacterium]
MTTNQKNIHNKPLACVVLAAGQGTRMKSSLPKVLHPVAGEPMICHSTRICEKLSADKITVVIAPDMEAVERAVAPYPCVIQTKPLGTGDAVKAAMPHLEGFEGDVLVLFGDTPLLTAESIARLCDKKAETDASIVVAGFLPDDPGAYGRLLVAADGSLESIVEAADATPEQKKVKLCNGGIMLFEAQALRTLLPRLQANNSKGEYYLTDCVELANKQGFKVSCTTIANDDVRGVNTRAHLAEVEAVMQDRLRQQHMAEGVTMIDPQSVFLRVDTIFGRDVVIESNVVFGANVIVKDNVKILSFSYLEGVMIEKSAVIGPFARIGVGSTVGEKAEIGNFVELKKTKVSSGAKIKHLSYIGMADIGEKANIGAGTITCNYDGFFKSRTVIGKRAFIGSNSALVAPVSIGDEAIVAAGSVITKNVPANALGFARAAQKVKEGWALLYRKNQEAKKRGA